MMQWSHHVAMCTTPLHKRQFLAQASDWGMTSRRMALVIRDRLCKTDIPVTANLVDAGALQRYERVHPYVDQDDRYRSLHHLMNLDEKT